MTLGMQQTQFIVESMYASVLNPELVPQTLQAIVEYCEVDKGALQLEDLTSQSVVQGGGYFGYDDSDLQSYFDYFSKQEPWTPKLVEKFGTQFGFVCSDQVLSLQDYKSSEFYNDWAKKLKIGRSVTCAFHVDQQLSIKFCLKQSDTREFTDKQVRKINTISPYLTHFAHLISNRCDSDYRGAFIDHLVHKASRPALVIDSQCRIVSHNYKFETALQNNEHLRVSQDKLGFKELSAQSAFRTLIKEMCLSTLKITQSSFPRIRSFTTPNNNGQLQLIPIPAIFTGKTLIFVCLSVPQVSSLELQTYLGLTSREALLCIALSDGDTLEGASDKLCQSIHTSRKQLKKIFARLQIQNQTELVNIVLHISELKQ